MNYTDKNKILARINYLKDKVLPAQAKAYKNAKKQLAKASMSRRRCLADWKVYRTTINVYIEASMDKRETEAELRKLRIILKTMGK
jgi:hypothetical protein